LIFDILIGLVACIALVITFFLLLVATRQNVRQNIWEYGVLRSIGVTKEQGKRIYMYEAFTVVTSAAILGTICGIINAVVLTAELCMFAEIPFSMDLPYFQTFMVLTVALTTTFIAVWVPVTAVNKLQISRILTGQC